MKYRHCNPECSKYWSLQSPIFWNELCHSVGLRYECVTCLTGGGTVLYLTQKTAAIKPMSLKITKAVSGAETEQTWWITWWATLPYTATAVTWNTRVQYLVWAQRRWDWRIKYWWGSYQPTGRERCPTPTSEWATSSRCNRPAELERDRGRASFNECWRSRGFNLDVPIIITHISLDALRQVFSTCQGEISGSLWSLVAAISSARLTLSVSVSVCDWVRASASVLPGQSLRRVQTGRGWGESAAGWSDDRGTEPERSDTHTESWGSSTGSRTAKTDQIHVC